MTDVIPKGTEIIRLRYTKTLYAYAYVDFGDIDLSQVAKVEAVKWCTLMLTMKDGSKEYVDTDIDHESSQPDWKRGFELCGLVDEEFNTLRDISTEEE
jgi:hypothetical protein